MSEKTKNQKRKAVVVLPLPLKDLDRLSAVLNKAASDGYAILASNFIPAKDGGILLYVLGDMSEPEPEAASEDLATDAPAGHNGNGSTDLGAGEIVEPTP